jgi:hypothetical protein
LLVEAVLESAKHPMIALKLFWPIILLAAGVVVTENVSAADSFQFDRSNPSAVFGYIGLFLLIFAAVVLLLLMSISGIVTWHRLIVLGEKAGWLSLWQGRRAIRYAGYLIVYGLILVLLFVPSSMLANSLLLVLGLGPVEGSFYEDLWATLTGLLAEFAVLLALGKWLFVYPFVATSRTKLKFRSIRNELEIKERVIGPLMLLSAGYSITEFAYVHALPISWQQHLLIPATVISICALSLTTLIGATVLSLAFRRNAKPEWLG